MSITSTPEGFDKWEPADWQRFAENFAGGEEGVMERHFTGAFGSYEVAVLIALSRGDITPESLMRAYGYSSLDMLKRWGQDVSDGPTNPSLDGFGVNSEQFVQDNFAAIKGMLL